MSIRLLAKDLYDAIKKVEKLENEIKELSPSQNEKKERLDDELRKLKAEKKMFQGMLEGRKNS